MNTARRGMLVGVMIAAALTLTACGAADETTGAEQVVAAVTEADARVVDATATESTSGLSSGWEVQVTLGDTAPVTADELSGLLGAIFDSGEKAPGHMYLIAGDGAGGDIDLAAPADELGLSWSGYSTGIGVTRSAWDAVGDSGE